MRKAPELVRPGAGAGHLERGDCERQRRVAPQLLGVAVAHAVVPSSTLPLRAEAPPWRSRVSVNVGFPEPVWPTRATMRTLSGGGAFIQRSPLPAGAGCKPQGEASFADGRLPGRRRGNGMQRAGDGGAASELPGDGPERSLGSGVSRSASTRSVKVPVRSVGKVLMTSVGTFNTEPALIDAPSVDILGLRFPRLTQAQAVDLLVEWVDERHTVGVAFPDMSTMNTTLRQPAFRRLLLERFVTFNDGAGMAMAARLRHRPFPANLNGTDLCPKLLGALPAGTSVYLLGGGPGVADGAQACLAARYPDIEFVGAHHGYLDHATEAAVASVIAELRPQIVMVGMGNPLQVQFISRYLDTRAFAGTMWLAIGGQLDYYGGGLERAPEWMVRTRLEWLRLVYKQPHKRTRYFRGIPLFLGRVLLAQVGREHDVEQGQP